MNDLTIHIDQASHIYKPEGLLFVERFPSRKIIFKYHALNCDEQSKRFVLRSFVTENDYEYELLLSEHYIYQQAIDVSAMPCARYEIRLYEQSIGYITISPYFSDIQMCTMLTHLAKPLLGAIEKRQLPYNWLHLTPVHRAGNSGSAYSLMSWHDDDFYLDESDLRKLRGYKIMTDVVLNHLSSDSPVLVDSCNSFNNLNRKDLKPAIVLDFHLQLLEYAILKNLEASLSIKNFTSMKRQIVLYDYFISKFSQLVKQIIENLRLYEFELIGKVDVQDEFHDMMKFVELNWATIVVLTGHRNTAMLNEERVVELLGSCTKAQIESIKVCYNQFVIKRYETEKTGIADSILNSVKYYLFGQEKAPHWFIMRYFAPITNNFETNNGQSILDKYHQMLKDCHGYTGFVNAHGYILEEIEKDEILFGACNGWVMGLNRDFIQPQDRSYITRSIISWGDSVKLNYVNNENLYKLAVNYVVRQAYLFNGLRIDNAHNTDQRILTEAIKEARKVNENLLVMLEIFTGDDGNNAYITQQCNGDITLKEMIHYDNCDKLAGLINDASYHNYTSILNQYNEPLYHRIQVPKLLFDVTHDNEPFGSPNSEHSVNNYLVYAAIAAFAEGAGSATTFGSDYGIAKHIEVQSSMPYSDCLNFELFHAKAEFLKLRTELLGYEYCYAHSYGDFLTIERQSSGFGASLVLVAMPRYKHQASRSIECIFDGVYQQTVCCYTSRIAETRESCGFETCDFTADAAGVEVKIKYDKTSFKISVPMTAGSVLVFRKRDESFLQCRDAVQAYLPGFRYQFSALSLIQRKQFLAMAEMEEIELTGKRLFDFNGLHPTICGFDGVRDCILRSDIRGQVAQNLRTGNWFFDYMIERNGLLKLGLASVDYLLSWIKENASRGQKPACTYLVIGELDRVINEVLCEQLGIPFDVLPAYLYRAGLLLIGFRKQWQNVDVNKWLTAEFKEAFDAKTETSDSQSEMVDRNAKRHRYTVVNWKKSRPNNPLYMISLAAGFPHFFDGMFRSWGRDIALAITGLVREKEALRVMLVSTASLVRHGLLPNLQDSGRNPRYNCRDAVWFWMCNIIEYIERFGTDILRAKVKRIFLRDEEENYYYDEQNQQFLYNQNVLMEINKISKEQTIEDVILHVLQAHWNGIDFVEWTCQDSNMRQEGKHVIAYADYYSGLVYGGNDFNCHTWMDKMGGSYICGNRGFPSTSRCGAAVEINFCARRVLTFFKSHFEDTFVYKWAALIDVSVEQFRSEKRGFKYLRDVISYKDARSDEQDFLLRPNYLIGLSFYDKAFVYRYRAEVVTCFQQLLEPFSIGMKTLAPFEKRYHSWYNNDDTSGFETANGFSYHNGPEWVFVYGRGLICLKLLGETDLLKKHLINIRRHMDIHCYINGDCKSLPELTQGNAAICGASCISQSWSLGSILQSFLQ